MPEYVDLLKKYKSFDAVDVPAVYFVDKVWFNLSIGAIIVVNTLMIGIDVDYAPRTGVLSEKLAWFLIDVSFTLLFVGEMAAKQYFYRWAYFKTNANRFDFLLVLFAVIDNLLSLMEVDAGIGKMRMLRMIRLIRLVRLVRLIRMFKGLWLVVSGLIQSLRTILWVSVLLLVLCYVCGILATLSIGRNAAYEGYEKISGGWDHRKYFGTLPRSMVTMFQIVTLENWCDPIVRHVLTNQPAMAIFFLIFIFLTTFGLLNLVVGIIVENTLSVARNNTTKIKKVKDLEQKRILSAMKDIFIAGDVDKSGTIDLEEFENMLQAKKVTSKLLACGIAVDEARELFHILDLDGSGILDIDEFVGGCLKLKGVAKSKDLLAVQMAMQSLSTRVEKLAVGIKKEEQLVEKLDVLSARMTRNYSEILQSQSMRRGEALRPKVPGTYIPSFPAFL